MTSEPIERLPRAYALALRLHSHGVGNELIAECLNVDAVAVPALLALANAKLAAMGVSGTDAGQDSWV